MLTDQMEGLQHYAGLADVRTQLHWAIQALAATADAALPREDDDRQSNLGFDSDTSSLVTHPMSDGRQFAMRIDRPTLMTFTKDRLEVAKLKVDGQSIQQLVAWCNVRLDEAGYTQRVKLRDYDMPDHPVAHGIQFDFARINLLDSLLAWSQLGSNVLEEAINSLPSTGPVRLWPHHLDFGSIILLDQQDDTSANESSIGIGMSLGDHYYNQPYFYINPYGLPESDKPRPEPQHGIWTQHWNGIVLTAEVAMKFDDSSQVVSAITEHIDLCRQLLRS